MMKFLVLFLSILTLSSIEAATWTKVELDMNSTLRVKNKRGVLIPLVVLKTGTKMRFRTDNSLRNALYKHSSGKVYRSKMGWYRTILIDYAPGVSDSKRKQINRRRLYISKSVLTGVSTGTTVKNTQSSTKTIVIQQPKTILNGSAHRCRTQFLFKKVPQAPLDEALSFYEKNSHKLDNKRYIAFTDFSMPYSEKRFFMLDLKTCQVQKEFLAHGSGNGPKGKNAKPTSCLNRSGTRTSTSRPGFALIKGYHWREGRGGLKGKPHWTFITEAKPQKTSLKMYGLERKNNDLLDKGVVFHENKKMNKNGTYRSNGCPVTYPGRLASVQHILKSGTLYFNYMPICQK